MANEILSQNAVMAIPKMVAADVLPAVIGNLVMGNLVNRNYDGALAQSGDVINISIAPVLTANNIAETGSVTNQNKSLGNAQLTLNKHIEASFAIPDVTQVFTRPDLVKTYFDSAVKAVAEQIETDLLNVYAQLTYNTAAGTANQTITEAAIDTAETALFTAKVPANTPKYLVLSGTAYGAARQLGRFSEYQTIGAGEADNPILTGQVLQIKGMPTFRSQYVAKVSTTTYNMVFARDAIGLVIRTLPVVPAGMGAIQENVPYGNFGMRFTMSYVPGQLQAQFTVDALYGCGVIRNNFGIQLLS